MHKPVALPCPKLVWVRSGLSVVALAAVLVLAVRLVVGSGSPPAGLLENLSGTHAPPVNQGAATRCFRASPAVRAVHSAGAIVLVRFVGQAGFMRLTFFANANAAIRASYAHGSANSFYGNTTWSQIPSRLTNSDYDALSTCLPMPKTAR
jgi:hypothetical protein